ncbi:MAG: glycosyl hydrolase [Patescibacteria group bacterium]|jgi:hypothetical protein
MFLPFNSPPAKASPNFEINIFLPEAVNNPAAFSSLEQNLGLNFSSATWYLDWSDTFTPDIAQGFQSKGKIPELSWQPQINGSGVSYDAVTAGGYNNYIDSFARSVQSLGFKIRIDLAPEMNADWEPWGMGNPGNNPDNFKAFWQYTVNRFRADGATNVEWIWAPNIHYWGEKYSFADIFPGNDYLDFMGLDGYNWGTTQPGSTWQSFQDVFGPSYNDLRNLSSKKILITEVASAEQGGSKAQWILDMFQIIPNKFPQIAGIYWFNENKETDWRIQSSASSLEAFKNAAQGDFEINSTQNAGASESQTSQDNLTTSNNSSSSPTKTNLGLDSSPDPPKTALPLSKTTYYAPKSPIIVKAFKGAFIALSKKNGFFYNLFLLPLATQNKIFFIIGWLLVVILLVFLWRVHRRHQRKSKLKLQLLPSKFTFRKIDGIIEDHSEANFVAHLKYKLG